MRPLPLLLVAGLLACTAPPPAPAPDRLIPAEATVIVGIDVGRTLTTEVYGLFKPLIVKDPKPAAAAAAAVTDCGFDPVAMKMTVLLGTDGDRNVAAVVRGDGVGDETKLRCLAGKLAAAANEGPISVVRTQAEAQEVPIDRPGAAIIVSPSTVVFTSQAWASRVGARLDGTGASIYDGPEGDLLRRTDQQAHFWVAGHIPPRLAQDLKPVSPQHVSLAIQLGGGLGIHVALGMAPDRSAELKQIVEQFETAKPILTGGIGFAEKTVETMRLTTDGHELVFDADIGTSDLLAMTKRFGPMLGMAEPVVWTGLEEPPLVKPGLEEPPPPPPPPLEKPRLEEPPPT